MAQVTYTAAKSIEKWSSRDFLIYYSNKLKDLTGRYLEIPSDAWMGFMSRIKGFKKKLKLTNIEYKHFIDQVFSNFFVKNKYEPTFGCIVSERVFDIVNKERNSNEYSNEDFEQIKAELYKDHSEFFKQFKLNLDE